MTTRKTILLSISCLLLAVIVTGTLVNQYATASVPKDKFNRVRTSVYDHLWKRVASPIDGVFIELPPGEGELEKILTPFPDQAHIEAVTRRQDWFGSGGFQLLLNLEDAVLLSTDQGNSNTMAATTLLNHYFSDLDKLGFRNLGSPGVVAGTIQSATNEWFDEHDRTVIVSGTVFVSPESKQAIVICKIREWFPKQ